MKQIPNYVASFAIAFACLLLAIADFTTTHNILGALWILNVLLYAGSGIAEYKLHKLGDIESPPTRIMYFLSGFLISLGLFSGIGMLKTHNTFLGIAWLSFTVAWALYLQRCICYTSKNETKNI